jgi:hypothetical protein
MLEPDPGDARERQLMSDDLRSARRESGQSSPRACFTWSVSHGFERGLVGADGLEPPTLSV